MKRALFAVLALAGLALVACLFAPLIAVGSVTAVGALSSPALAAEAQAVGDAAVTMPYGQGIVAVLDLAKDIAVPALTILIGTVILRAFPLARMFLTDELVERTVRKWLDFALADVEGAAKNRTLSVPVGSKVVAAGLQRAIDRADTNALSRWALDQAGGPAEVAHKFLRMLNLEPGATAAKVIAPAIEALPGKRR